MSTSYPSWAHGFLVRSVLLIFIYFSVLCCVFILFIFVPCLVCSMLPMSVDCPFLIDPSIFLTTSVHLNKMFWITRYSFLSGASRFTLGFVHLFFNFCVLLCSVLVYLCCLSSFCVLCVQCFSVSGLSILDYHFGLHYFNTV